MLENGHVAVFRKSMQIRACPCAPEQKPASTTATARSPHNSRSGSSAFHAARISRSRAPLISLSRKPSTISRLLIIERQNNWRIFEHVLRTFQPQKLESHASSLDTVAFYLPYVTNRLATLDPNLVFFKRLLIIEQQNNWRILKHVLRKFPAPDLTRTRCVRV